MADGETLIGLLLGDQAAERQFREPAAAAAAPALSITAVRRVILSASRVAGMSTASQAALIADLLGQIALGGN